MWTWTFTGKCGFNFYLCATFIWKTSCQHRNVFILWNFLFINDSNKIVFDVFTVCFVTIENQMHFHWLFPWYWFNYVVLRISVYVIASTVHPSIHPSASVSYQFGLEIKHSDHMRSKRFYFYYSIPYIFSNSFWTIAIELVRFRMQ